jgi:hypothetical protein
MHPDKDKLLCEKYPKLFSERYLPMTQTCMYWGFEHGDGWFNIIDALCANIQHHIDSSADHRKSALEYNEMISDAKAGNWEKFDNYWTGSVNPEYIAAMRNQISETSPRKVSEEIPQVVVTQVKEKFGTLRFYYNGGNDYVDGMVRMAESMSGCTCEQCGAPGTQIGSGWISTRCEGCISNGR